jgi:hypothetical protein
MRETKRRIEVLFVPNCSVKEIAECEIVTARQRLKSMFKTNSLSLSGGKV